MIVLICLTLIVVLLLYLRTSHLFALQFLLPSYASRSLSSSLVSLFSAPVSLPLLLASLIPSWSVVFENIL